jgi:hypothetical protein
MAGSLVDDTQIHINTKRTDVKSVISTEKLPYYGAIVGAYIPDKLNSKLQLES